MAEGTRVWVAGPDEIGAAGRLLFEFREWLGGKGSPDATEMTASAQRVFESGDEYLLGSAGGDEPVGVCQLRYRWSVWTSSEDCWLEDLFVREDARGSGLGRALVEAAFERARERGCGRIELDVNEHNAPALALYEALGFSLESKGDGRNYLAGRYLS